MTTPGAPINTPPDLTGINTFTLLITDWNLKPMLPPLLKWRQFEVTIKRNEVGSGQVVLTGDPAVLVAAGTPNARMCIIRNPIPSLGITGSVLASGPIEQPGPQGWSMDDESGMGAGTITISFATNELYLAERITYPNPAVQATAQGAAFWTVTNQNAETVLRNLVNLNAGPGALVARRVPNLALGAVAGVGSNVSYTTRFEVLTDALRAVALAGGSLNFRVRDTTSQLLFEVSAPTLRGNALFARSRGNLRALEVTPQNPSATAAIVGGSGTGASRTVYESAPASSWRRMETFVNQSETATAAELAQAAADALADKGESVGVTPITIDPWGAGYGSKYQLGDKVPVVLNNGTVRTDVITAVTVTCTADGGSIFKPAIGTGDPYTDTKTVQLLRDMNRRLRKLAGT